MKELYYREAPGTWHPGWLVRVQTPAGPVQLLNVHLRPPVAECPDGVYRFGLRAFFGAFKVRRKQLEQLVEWTDLGTPTVVLGDFNEQDGDPAIAWARKEKGLANATSQFDPWASTRNGWSVLLPFGRRLDQVLYSPQLKCLHSQVIKGGGSDHRAVMATFEKK